MKNSTLSIIFILFAFLNLSPALAQCSVTAPGDITINCGGSASATATTSAVTYTVVPSACAPVTLPSPTTAFPTACDDCVTGQIPLGFNFNFYGNTYNSAVIQSNGLVGFGPFTFTGFSSFAIPAGGNPNNYIAGIFADIDIRFGGTITYQTVGTAPNRQFVVYYNNVVPYNLGTGAGTGTATFQIVINENGSFQVIISQFSANWNASTSGALATSGAENIDGTYAFPIPGRNATDWPGISPAAQDCWIFNPQPCVFQRWQQGATVITTSPTLTVSPTATTTYTAYWNCGGTICTDDMIVNVIPPTITAGTVTNNTNCTTPNGSATLNFNNFNPGTYTLNYLLNGVPQTQSIVIAGSAPVAQGAVFNSGTLSTTDLTWNRNAGGTVCGGTAGTQYYLDVASFTPSISGSYTFNMCTPGTDWDGHASLYQNGFNNTNPCGTPGNFIIADDDGNTGGNCDNDSQITATLTAGTTYYIVTTSFTAGVTGNYQWTYTGPSGATISTAVIPSYTFSNLGTTSFTNFSMNSGTCGTATLAGPITITSPPSPTTTGVTICQGGTGTISSTSCGTTGTTVAPGAVFNSGSLATTDPTWNRNTGGTTCNGSATGAYYYDVASFTVATTGAYVLNMCTPGTDWDGHASLYQNAFTPSNPCGVTGNFILADDDTNTGGNCENDAQLSVTLTAGITYYLVTTSFSTSTTGNYQWTFTGPGNINFGATGGVLEWYTAPSGGTSISSANPFNPVGVAGSGLANTNTAGTTTYYAACSTNPNCRTAATFVIRPRPTGVISGTGTICNASTTISITLTGTQPWNVTYTNGSTPTTVTGITSSPYTFNVSPSGSTTYTLTALSDAYCTSIATDLTGSATVSGKRWLGTTNANWTVTSNWSGGTLPNGSDCVVIPVTANNPIISGSGTVGLAGTLSILNGASLTVQANNTMSVTNQVSVGATGNFYINDNASLVQINNPGTANTGNITMTRNADLKIFDYVYWSSPVSSFASSAISPATPTSFIWKWNPTINGNDYGIWVNGSENMVVGKGYIVRAPNSYPNTAVANNFVTNFIGVPNNGNLSAQILRGTRTSSYPSPGGTATAEDDNWNLVGNPYPSAIDANTFLSSNLSIDGTIRMWTHGLSVSTVFVNPFYGNYTYNYSINDYVTYNSMGSTPPGFLGKIAAGQAFFVQMNHGTSTPSTVVFNNGMRNASYSNSQFYKGSSSPIVNTDPDKHRIWLTLENSDNQTSTSLVGYATGATLEKDREFDSTHKPDLAGIGIYSLIDDKPMIIQGRPTPFDQNDEIPIGVTMPAAGAYSIGILLADGLFEQENQPIYLEDKLLGIDHNLRQNPYNFTSESGDFADRFLLKYVSDALGNPEFNDNQITVASNTVIQIHSTNELLDSIIVYDILGRKLADYRNVNATEFTIKNLLKNNTTLLLEIKTESGAVSHKKIIY